MTFASPNGASARRILKFAGLTAFVALALLILLMLRFALRPGYAVTSTQNRTLVLIVPGTTGNAGSWPKEILGKFTFGSELKRGFGDRVEIYPYLWDGDNDHASREKAAASLATLIDRKSSTFGRICLVGHSYGGDISLRAAGLCRSKIDTVICLSTPHLYLDMRADSGNVLPVPVYCSYEARQNARVIINIHPDGDYPIIALANIKKDGPTEKTAIPMTQSWQEHNGFPRLADDSQLSRLLGAEQYSNFRMAETLNVADANVQFHSSARPGKEQHEAVHSRRMGYLLGQLLRDPQSTDRLGYIRSFMQPKNTDTGEPVPQDFQDN